MALSKERKIQRLIDQMEQGGFQTLWRPLLETALLSQELTAEELRAYDADGLQLLDKDGNLGLHVKDGGKIEAASGTGIDEFSTDGTMAGDSDDAIPTEKAVKTYADSVGAAVDKISEGNSNVDVIDAGTGQVDVDVDGTRRAMVNALGLQLGETGPRIASFVDEDDMTSDSAVRVPTQQSVKAYVGNQLPRDVNSYGGLEGAITAIGATVSTVMITSTQTLTANRVIPATMSVVILKGGSITGAYTLTFNGPLDAGLYQIFSSTITVNFGVGSVLESYLEWRGGSGDDTVTCNDAMTKTIASMPSKGGTIRIPAGVYKFSVVITITTKMIRFRGDGAGMSRLKFYDCNGLAVNNSAFSEYLERSFILDGVGIETTVSGTRTAISFTGTSTTSFFSPQLLINDCGFGFPYLTSWKYGVLMTSADGAIISNSSFMGHPNNYTHMTAAVQVDGSTDIKLLGNYYYFSDYGVAIIGQSEGVVIAHSHFVPCNYGVYSAGDTDPSNYVVVNNCHISAHYTGIKLYQGSASGSRLSKLSDNVIFKNDSSTQNFIGIDLATDRVSVIGNTIMNAGTSGNENGIVLRSGASYCTVIGNQLSDIDGSGVWLQAGADRNTVVGNTGVNITTNVTNTGANNIVANNAW